MNGGREAAARGVRKSVRQGNVRAHCPQTAATDGDRPRSALGLQRATARFGAAHAPEAAAARGERVSVQVRTSRFSLLSVVCNFAGPQDHTLQRCASCGRVCMTSQVMNVRSRGRMRHVSHEGGRLNFTQYRLC